ncbi:MAG: GNAT family N-acetyltransferase [Elusimicrobia bacterium GWB2_63_22]|nr:MAG: GNAT family N-acetyltransferase [Elusimicrobia bacterium GWB2_63_22]
MKYQQSIESITPAMLQGFFVDWPNPPAPKTHLRLLKNSDMVVLAIDTKTRLVIGFITAISDRVLSCYIPFLEVLPAYQGRKIGQKLVRKMLQKLKSVYMIDLMCDKKLQGFYKRFKMQPSTGMISRNYKNQSGKTHRI